MNQATLGAVAEYVNGAAFKESDWGDTGRRIIRIQNLNDSHKPYNRTTRQVKDSILVRPGDLLVSWSASLGVYEWTEPDEAVLNQHIFRVVPDLAVVDKQYLRRVLEWSIDKLAGQTHGATMKHLTRKVFLGWPIPLPGIEEQRRIAAVLDAADDLRTKRRQTLAKLDTLTQAIFIDMFGDPVTNPRGHGLGSLLDLGELDRGVSKHRPRNDPALLGGRWPLIQTGDVANSGGYISSHTMSYSDLGLGQSRLWPAGTLCITIAANIARTGILKMDACFPDSVVGFTADREGDEEFVRTFMNFLQPILEAGAPESAQKNINLKVLRSLPVPIPDVSLRRAFAVAVERANRSISRASLALDRYDTLFASLQQRAFAGEL